MSSSQRPPLDLLRTAGTAIRWRRNELQQRWTRVHAIDEMRGGAEVTLCNLAVPEHPYDEARDGWIPENADLCLKCLAKAEAQ